MNSTYVKEKKILITGKSSYIGRKLQEYSQIHYPKLKMDAISVRDDAWKERDFSAYDVIIHLAGIAHSDVEKMTSEREAEYYRVNTELTLSVAEQAKREGVKQFVFASSMIIYGESKCSVDRIIDSKTIPKPINAYGDSKWKADVAIREMADNKFKIAILRLPMVYGPECRGNFRTLERIASMIPVFPDVGNRRSMIYIDNLCEFICLLVCKEKYGIFFPQNAEYINTARLIKEMGKVKGRRICITSKLTGLVNIASKLPGKTGRMVNKAFGSMIYDMQLSKYDDMEYQLVGFRDSLRWLGKNDE